MKKIIALFCSFALFCGIFLGVTTETNASQAETTKELKVTMEKTSGELVAGADVTFKIAVTNPTNETMTMNTFNNFSYGPVNDGENGDGEDIGCITDENGNLIADSPNLPLEPGINLAAQETKTFTLTGTLPQAWTEEWHITIVVGDIDFTSDNPPRWYGQCNYPESVLDPENPSVELVSGQWNGQSDIVFEVHAKSIEVDPTISYLKNDQVLGTVTAEIIQEINENGDGYIQINNLKLLDATTPAGERINWGNVDMLRIRMAWLINGVESPFDVDVPVEFPKEEGQKPQLASGTWTGEKNIEIQLPEGATGASLGEVYGYRQEVSIAGIRVAAAVQGNKLVIKNEDLKKAIDNMSGQPVDWTTIDKLEVGIFYKLGEEDKYSFVFIPVNYKETEPVKPERVLKDHSGVSMVLPESAPSGLVLKVAVTSTTAEKDAISKLVQVKGDRMRTFDLSLWKDGKEWNYNGQFKSKVTLPVQEGWNLDALGLYYYDEATNKASEVAFTVDKKNRTVTFETNHFSKYVLVEKAAENTSTVSPKTGDHVNIALYIILAAVTGAVIVSAKRRRT